MIVNYYELRGEKAYVYENPPRIEIAHPHTEPSLEVIIGIDPSTSSTGFTIGRTDMDYPIIGVEFKRDKDEDHFIFINRMMDYIIYCILGVNNLNVTHIFSEDKYEFSKKYKRNTMELLSAVKVAINSLPSRIKDNGQFTRPKLYLMKPSEWRKTYLGTLNTNAKRDAMKRIVTEYTVNKYQFHRNVIFYEDFNEAVGIYSAGFRKHIEPNLSTSAYAMADFNNIDWAHHVTYLKLITSNPHESLKKLPVMDRDIKSRIDKYGIKGFDYQRGHSLEKNMRGLTSKSNAVFVTILESWDLEAIPIYYELRQTPNDNDKLLLVAYRKIEKAI